MTSPPSNAQHRAMAPAYVAARGTQRARFFASCTCGWRSTTSYSTAGMAGAAADRHVDEAAGASRSELH